MNKRLFLLIFIFCGITAIGQNLSFHHFTTDDGLSHNSVMTLYQDERGWIWMGTRDGLNLYNGKEFKVYKYEKDNPIAYLTTISCKLQVMGKEVSTS